jgi:hypothetical protein
VDDAEAPSRSGDGVEHARHDRRRHVRMEAASRRSAAAKSTDGRLRGARCAPRGRKERRSGPFAW